jgi:hypothetical protein
MQEGLAAVHLSMVPSHPRPCSFAAECFLEVTCPGGDGGRSAGGGGSSALCCRSCQHCTCAAGCYAAVLLVRARASSSNETCHIAIEYLVSPSWWCSISQLLVPLAPACMVLQALVH